MTTIALLIDQSPEYLHAGGERSSLLLARVGVGTLLRNWCSRLAQANVEPIAVLSDSSFVDDHKKHLMESVSGIRILHCDQLGEFLHERELTDQLIIVNTRYYPIEIAELTSLLTAGHRPAVIHLTCHPGLRPDIRERVVVDSDRRVRRIERLYAGVTNLAPMSAACSLLSVAAARCMRELNHQIVGDLRSALVLTGLPIHDIPLSNYVIDLGVEQGLLNLNEYLLKNDSEPGSDTSLHQIQSGIWAPAQCQIHPASKLSGPLVISRDVTIQAKAQVIGPTVLGVGATIGVGAIISRCIIGDHVHVSSGSRLANRVLMADNKPSDAEPKSISWTEHLETEQARHELHQAMRVQGNNSTGDTLYNVAKRVFDCTAALCGLLVLLPLLLIVALIIKLTSDGPVIFGHSRESRNGRSFRCWKFRTMVENAHAQQRSLYNQNGVDGPQFKLQNDPRVTRIGRILRSTNIDEIPQLINVLRGDMSFVGPRPSPFRENQICIPWREARLSVLPGITGLWQVCRHDRDNGDFHQWIYYDVLYTRHRSFALDMRILLATFLTLGGRWGAPVSWIIPGYHARGTRTANAEARSRRESSQSEVPPLASNAAS